MFEFQNQTYHQYQDTGKEENPKFSEPNPRGVEGR